MKLNMEDSTAVSLMVIGSENKLVSILDPGGMRVIRKVIWLRSWLSDREANRTSRTLNASKLRGPISAFMRLHSSCIPAQVELESVPAFMNVMGRYEVDYRITVACRDGKIYTIKNGQATSLVKCSRAKVLVSRY